MLYVKAEQMQLQNCALEGRLGITELVKVDENGFGS